MVMDQVVIQQLKLQVISGMVTCHVILCLTAKSSLKIPTVASNNANASASLSSASRGEDSRRESQSPTVVTEEDVQREQGQVGRGARARVPPGGYKSQRLRRKVARSEDPPPGWLPLR